MSKIKPVILKIEEISKLKDGLKNYKVNVEFNASYKTETPYTPLKRTRKSKKDDIDIFMDHIISLWTLYLHIYIKNVYAATSNPLSKEFDNNELRDYYMHGEIMSSVIGICIDELQNFLYELQIGVYNGAIRTLRYLLEVTIDCCLFQIDGNTHTIDQLNNFAKSKENVMSYMNYHNSWISFIERYKLYEDTRRMTPSFKEKINKINSKNFFKQAPILNSKIKDLYAELSSSIHPNIQRIKKHIVRNTLPPPNYNKNMFNNTFTIGLEIIDIITYFFLLTITHYYSYKDFNECLKDYSDNIYMPEKSIKNHFNLKFTSKLCKDIKWKKV